MTLPIAAADYEAFLRAIKTRIQTARHHAALAVNRELVLLYWHIGHEIATRQHDQGWGAKVVDRLAADLRLAFPDMKGFSPRNLKYMRAFAQAYPDESIVQQAAAQLPWSHLCILLDKVKAPEEREWYIAQTVQNGWSRNVLVHQIESGLYQRQGKAVTNFAHTLPAPQSDLAQQLFKDPYVFDFLTGEARIQERDLQRGLLTYLRDFLLELGSGFAFVGGNYHLEVGDQDFFLDLLFYHLRLRCFVVIDLKIGDFQPEYAGKMNFYLAAVDDMLRQPADQPSIGIILCKSRNRLIAEYALRDMQAPLGVATFRLTDALPEHLQGQLPTIADLEASLQTMPEPDAISEEDT